MKIIDTHVHIWDLSRIRLPWLDNAGAVLNRSYLLSDYLNEWKQESRFQLDRVVYIEVDAAFFEKEKENSMLEDQILDRQSPIDAGIISGRLTDENFTDYLDRYSMPQIRGVRHVLHVPESPGGVCLKPVFLKNMQELGKRGLLFEACMRNEELGDLYETALQCPDTLIVLDHMGNVDPARIAEHSPENDRYRKQWCENMDRLASLDNVFCKVSGLNPEGGWTVEMLKPAVDYVLDCFGEDRVMYASNFPVCNISTGMRPWLAALDRITESRGDQFRRKLFSENARKVYFDAVEK
jgi:L-fuconolactonase